MCLNIGTPIFFNFPFDTNGKSMVLGAPVLMHIRIHPYALFQFSKGLSFWVQDWLAFEKIPIPKGLLLKKRICFFEAISFLKELTATEMGGKILPSKACIGSE